MLTSLYIENVAVIEKVEINFSQGLNILTGETGAGKSIVIDAINAILGGRVSKEIIRNGANSAFISATFDELHEKVVKLLHKLGFDLEDDGSITVQREITLSGKSNAKLNGRPIVLSNLKQISSYLVNIHGQHESYNLFSQDSHLGYLDQFANTKKEHEEYINYFMKLKELKQKIDKLSLDEEEKKYRTEMLCHQISEIESANLIDGEEEKLIHEKNLYKNKELISRTLTLVFRAINGDEETDGALSTLELANRELCEIENVFPRSKEISTRLSNLIYELEDLGDEITIPDMQEVNINTELNRIEERLALISSLCKKYGGSISEVLKSHENAKKELQAIEVSDEELEKNLKEFNRIKENVKLSAYRLSKKREQYAKIFAEKIKSELIYLDMPKIELVVSQSRCKLNDLGCDEIEFLVSTNPGEPPRALSKIASGGELSRIMLAIKNVLSGIDDADTMIFDEVDSGISGSAAQKVGLKLKSISHTKQVICVTHLAQIAALANTHFKILKQIKDNRTFTLVKPLSFDERKLEIARIIGGLTITDLTLKNAEEMLSLAKTSDEQ